MSWLEIQRSAASIVGVLLGAGLAEEADRCRGVVDQLAPGVRRQEAQPLREALVEPQRHRMIDGLGARDAEGADAVVLRERAQQPRPLHRLESKRRRRVGDDAEKRIRHLILQRRAEAQIRRIELRKRDAALSDQQIRTLAAEIRDFSRELARQLALHVEVPLMHVWRRIRREHAAVAAADPQAKEGRGSLGAPGRQVEAVGEWIVDGAQRNASVEAHDHVALAVEAHHARGARVAGGLNVRWHVVEPVGRSNDRLFVSLYTTPIRGPKLL